ncbi:M28 family metallopeptidase [Streptomyces sp. LX-29]|uniref:M28 family metallopeptidase n=1 Tax=Streptomyces sp. LX-29 TaxID=2900152 RepID=UPI00240D5817|nr:M28 family metallopeptidase [Streptomyces sp. LX-29]WFB08302.1 M28 family metallopeptidase [Streptomyces sp. LX-29]
MDVRSLSSARRAVAALAAAALATPLLISSASAAPAQGAGHGEDPAKKARKLARQLVRASSAEGALDHLERLQEIAEESDGHRAAGSPGHNASAAYVYKLLRKAGYRVSYQPFEFTYTEALAEKLSVVSPAPRDVPIKELTYTKSTPVGGITAAVAVARVDDTPGCEAADYASGGFTGKIALIKRGGCAFADKQKAAAEAGAVGAIVYNHVPGALNGTIGDPADARIPTGGISQADGEALVAEAGRGEVTVTLEVRELQEKRRTHNVIAETRGGNPDRTVMLGSHLDSVAAGPGINDNGSGSAGLLEVALELAETHKKPTNKIRFAWWSAEELGLLGSDAYVAKLTEAQRKQIALYLNFDMIASPNAAQFVYDGDNSDGVGAPAGPAGSAQLEKQINDFLDRRGLPHEGTDFTGRSDYGPFIKVGIPSGGTFTGAEGVKTAGQAAKYGGEAGVAYDACYHAACDDIDNLDLDALDTNVDVIANAVGTYAHDLSSLSEPVTTVPTTGDAGSGGGLHDDHDRVTE